MCRRIKQKGTVYALVNAGVASGRSSPRGHAPGESTCGWNVLKSAPAGGRVSTISSREISISSSQLPSAVDAAAEAARRAPHGEPAARRARGRRRRERRRGRASVLGEGRAKGARGSADLAPRDSAAAGTGGKAASARTSPCGGSLCGGSLGGLVARRARWKKESPRRRVRGELTGGEI